MSELILTIASLCVRHEFCLVVEEAGGLKFLLNAMVFFLFFSTNIFLTH